MSYYTEGFVDTITYKGETVTFSIRPTTNYLAHDIKGVTNVLLFVDERAIVHNASPNLQFAVNRLMSQVVLQAKMANLRCLRVIGCLKVSKGTSRSLSHGSRDILLVQFGDQNRKL